MTTADLEARIKILEDREKIMELRANYCFLVDDGKFAELVETCFTKDASCDFRTRQEAAEPQEPLISNGRTEILAFFQDVVAKTLRDMSHTLHNHRIDVQGDQASGDCYFELTARNASTGVPMIGTGRYLDRYRREAGVWQFEQRNADISHIVPLSEGW